MDTNTPNPWLEGSQNTPPTGTAAKALGWTLLLPSLAAFWLFKLPFRIAGTVLAVAAENAAYDEVEDENDEEPNLYEIQQQESDFDFSKYYDREGGYKYGEYLGDAELNRRAR